MLSSGHAGTKNAVQACVLNRDQGGGGHCTGTSLVVVLFTRYALSLDVPNVRGLEGLLVIHAVVGTMVGRRGSGDCRVAHNLRESQCGTRETGEQGG